MRDEEERDFDHLRLMIDLHRHITLLSFAGLVLTANLARRIFESPSYEYLAVLSIVLFFVSGNYSPPFYPLIRYGLTM